MRDSRRAATFVALLILAVAGPMCGSGGGGGGGGTPGGGGTAFQVLAHNPATPAIPVARTATIYLTVNGNTLPGSLAGNITVTGPTTPTLAMTWNPATSNIEIQPNALNQNATYTVTVTSGVTTTTGIPMTPTSFTFTTVNSTDNIRPAFGGLTSITGAGTTQLTLNWTKGTDASGSTSLVYDAYISTTSGFQNFSNPPAKSSLADAGSMTLTGLSSNLGYFVIVRARDTSGNQDLNTTEQSSKTLVSFATNIYSPIVNTICVVCHAPGGADPWMDLQTGGSSNVVTNVWVNVAPAPTGSGTAPDLSACGQPGPPVSLKRVVANDLTNSLVYLKLIGTQPCGVQMPKGGPFLSSTQTDLFRDWILQGANDN